ncbi:MAG: YicC family protein [Burkholderiales bacterium]|nr:YicC family protein [Burkholderiales bacterium]
MAVYSMTGYATASTAASSAASGTAPAAAGGVVFELRSVNGRFLDLSLRLPDELRALEPALRELLSGAFRRGKIELRATAARAAEGEWPAPAAEQLHRLAHLDTMVRSWLPQARGLSVHEALQWCRGAGPAAQPDELLLQAARNAVAGLREARAREGARLAEVLHAKLRRLHELAAAAEPMVPAVVQRLQQRFIERWNEALAAAGGAIGAEQGRERALNEATAFAIRIDVAEELARLRSHLDEVARLLDAGGEIGKRLDFLIQELQREANTLGSKSAALELTNVSVEMKVLIEQMREQVQNIE